MVNSCDVMAADPPIPWYGDLCLLYSFLHVFRRFSVGVLELWTIRRRKKLPKYSVQYYAAESAAFARSALVFRGHKLPTIFFLTVESFPKSRFPCQGENHKSYMHQGLTILGLKTLF